MGVSAYRRTGVSACGRLANAGANGTSELQDYQAHRSHVSHPLFVPPQVATASRRYAHAPLRPYAYTWAYPARFPFNASPNHPPNIPKPPRGVIAPSQRIFVNARRYKEPLKSTRPPNMSQNASRGNGSHREITKRTTACTRLYNTPVCQIESVPSASKRERNAWAPKAPKATAKKPLKAARVLDK
jgi:hypothetical protein